MSYIKRHQGTSVFGRKYSSSHFYKRAKQDGKMNSRKLSVIENYNSTASVANMYLWMKFEFSRWTTLIKLSPHLDWQRSFFLRGVPLPSFVHRLWGRPTWRIAPPCVFFGNTPTCKGCNRHPLRLTLSQHRGCDPLLHECICHCPSPLSRSPAQPWVCRWQLRVPRCCSKGVHTLFEKSSPMSSCAWKIIDNANSS